MRTGSKAKLVVASLLVFMAIGVAGAEAFVWHMRYGQAKNASKQFVQELCREDPSCTGWGVGQCLRKSPSSFSCVVGTFYANQPEVGQEMECDVVLHWGASRGGYIELKRHGQPRCFQV